MRGALSESREQIGHERPRYLKAGLVGLAIAGVLLGGGLAEATQATGITGDDLLSNGNGEAGGRAWQRPTPPA